MQKVHFDVGDSLLEEIDKAIQRWSFASRAARLRRVRFVAIDFLRHDDKLILSEKALEDNARAIRAVKMRFEQAEAKRDWREKYD